MPNLALVLVFWRQFLPIPLRPHVSSLDIGFGANTVRGEGNCQHLLLPTWGDLRDPGGNKEAPESLFQV